MKDRARKYSGVKPDVNQAIFLCNDARSAKLMKILVCILALIVHVGFVMNKIGLTRPTCHFSRVLFDRELRITFKSPGAILDRPINACRIKRRRDTGYNSVSSATDRRGSDCKVSINKFDNTRDTWTLSSRESSNEHYAKRRKKFSEWESLAPSSW